MNKLLAILLLIICGCSSRNHVPVTDLRSDLSTLEIDQVSFDNADISEVVEFLKHEWLEQTGSLLAVEITRHGRGNILPITISVHDLSMFEFLFYVCEMSNTSFEINKTGIYIEEIEFELR